MRQARRIVDSRRRTGEALRAAEANVGVPGAEHMTTPPDDLLFKLCAGATCVLANSYINTVLADAANDWTNVLEGVLDAGFYTIGIVDKGLGGIDPPFYVNFATPTTATNQPIPNEVPEPRTMLLIGVSFAVLSVFRRKAA